MKVVQFRKIFDSIQEKFFFENIYRKGRLFSLSEDRNSSLVRLFRIKLQHQLHCVGYVVIWSKVCKTCASLG